MALLRFEHLSFSYPLADMRALDDVSLEIHKGSMWCCAAPPAAARPHCCAMPSPACCLWGQEPARPL